MESTRFVMLAHAVVRFVVRFRAVDDVGRDMVVGARDIAGLVGCAAEARLLTDLDRDILLIPRLTPLEA